MEPKDNHFEKHLMQLKAAIDCVVTMCHGIENSINEINDGMVMVSNKEAQIYLSVQINMLEEVYRRMREHVWDIEHLDKEEVAAPAEPVHVKNVEITFTPSSPFVGAPITCSQENENADKED